MPLFVAHLLTWLLKSGQLHIVQCSLISYDLVVYISSSFILNSCIILLIYIMNNTGERPHSCLTPLFMCIGSDIPSLNLSLTFVFL